MLSFGCAMVWFDGTLFFIFFSSLHFHPSRLPKQRQRRKAQTCSAVRQMRVRVALQRQRPDGGALQACDATLQRSSKNGFFWLVDANKRDMVLNLKKV